VNLLTYCRSNACELVIKLADSLRNTSGQEASVNSCGQGHSKWRAWALLLALLLLMSPISTKEARTQGRAELESLKNRVDRLNEQVAALERFRQSIVCGRVDFDLLKDAPYDYPMTCQASGDQPSVPSRSPRITSTLVRPGVYRFEFKPPRIQTPIVLATASNRWGAVTQETSSIRVVDVDQTGFTVEILQVPQIINPTNLGFFFVVLGESPPPHGARPPTWRRR
jgi:hypothetical protein